MILHLFTQAELHARAALEVLLNVPKTLMTVLVMAFFVTAGTQSASAAEITQPKTAVDPIDFIGCPDLGWLENLTGASQQLTGMIMGIIVVLVIIVGLLTGIGFLSAGKDERKTQEQAHKAKNIGIGVLIIFVGVPILCLVIWQIATAVNPNC